MGEVTDQIIAAYNIILNALPNPVQTLIELFLWSLLIFVSALLIWKFYRSVSKKNILGLNLNKYNKSEHPLFAKILAGVFYLLEYILILPFLIFIWFGAFTLFLILLAENLDVPTILKIAIVVIAAIRMTAYYKEELSKDLAKMLPFALLAIIITNPTFFTDFPSIFQNLAKIPESFSQIGIYFTFIIALEVILRLFDFIISLFGFQDKAEIEKEEEE
jgi:hypothetical protein